MMIDKRDIYNCIYAAEKNIYEARTHLEKGMAVNWVCDEIHTAIMWAMQAWLLGNGHKPATRNGWNSMQAQFFELAPEHIRKPAIYCASHAVMLNYDQEGGFDHKEEPMPFERWREWAFEIIGKAEEIIVTIEKEIGCPEDELKSLWLYKRNVKD